MKRCTGSCLRFDGERPAQRVHDGARDCEAKSGPLTNRFRGEERIEDPPDELGSYSGPVVDHRQPHLTYAAPTAADLDQIGRLRRRRQRLCRVHEQVHEHLCQPGLVRKHRRQVGEVPLHACGATQFVLRHADRGIDDWFEIHRLKCDVLARQRTQPAHDPSNPVGTDARLTDDIAKLQQSSRR